MTAADRREIERIRAAYARRQRAGLDRRYSPFEPAHLFQTQSLERALLSALKRLGIRSLGGLTILDVGCGTGGWLTGLARYGAEQERLVGVDLRPEVLERSASRANFAAASASQLPFASDRFDMVCQLTMMSSVLSEDLRRQIAGEMLRVLRPGGIVLWYDFTVNPMNPDVAGIDETGLRALFPGGGVDCRRVTLAPPLSRMLAARAWLLCSALEQVPWFRTHLLATVVKACQELSRESMV
jgi:SAM-dependent methyltransferase